MLLLLDHRLLLLLLDHRPPLTPSHPDSNRHLSCFPPGHSYLVYGPLLNGATGIVFEGVPFYPDAGRFWEICAKYRVSKFYTAPTAIRALMKFGDSWVCVSERY